MLQKTRGSGSATAGTFVLVDNPVAKPPGDHHYQTELPTISPQLPVFPSNHRPEHPQRNWIETPSVHHQNNNLNHLLAAQPPQLELNTARTDDINNTDGVARASPAEPSPGRVPFTTSVLPFGSHTITAPNHHSPPLPFQLPCLPECLTWHAKLKVRSLWHRIGEWERPEPRRLASPSTPLTSHTDRIQAATNRFVWAPAKPRRTRHTELWISMP